jgi:hypothetical protein
MEKLKNYLQFRNNFLASLRKCAQFSKHSVSFMQFSGPYVLGHVTSISKITQYSPTEAQNILFYGSVLWF